MSIYRGHLGEISNKADWLSPVFQFLDAENDDEAIDLSAATEIYFEIKHPETKTVLVEATLANGKIAFVDDSNTEFQVSLAPSDLSSICEGQYLANLSFTLNDIKYDPVLATVAVIEGAGS